MDPKIESVCGGEPQWDFVLLLLNIYLLMKRRLCLSVMHEGWGPNTGVDGGLGWMYTLISLQKKP